MPSRPSGRACRAIRTARAAGRSGSRDRSRFLGQVHPVAPVAAEALVAAVARQRHGHVLARQLADPVGRQRGTVGIRLVVDAGQAVDDVESVAGDRVDEMARTVALGHLPRELRFVERRIVERDRAGVDRLVGDPRHRRDHGAGIDAARKKRAERHLGDHAQAYRFLQAVAPVPRRPRRDRSISPPREAHVPVLDGRARGLRRAASVRV